MIPEAKIALEDSIQHWERMLDLTHKQIKEQIEEPSWSNCALCVLYINNTTNEGDCVGCPIAAKGYPVCHDTPYIHASQVYRELGRLNKCTEEEMAEFKKAVTDEIEFLKSIRE